MYNRSKKGIALLITLFFIMAITISIGVGLKQLKDASKSIEGENFLLQSNMILDDVLRILKNDKNLQEIAKDESGEAFSIFLSQASFIPFESSGIKVIMELKSARSKFNINAINTQNIFFLKQYVGRYMVSGDYIDILQDFTHGNGNNQEQISYNSDIFYTKPELFRAYIVSKKHLDEINEFYTMTYHDNSLKNIQFKNIFYYSNDADYKIDLNHATPDVWEMMLGCDKLRAKELSSGVYEKLDDIVLNNDEKSIVSTKFKTSFFEPYLDVSVEIIQNSQSAKISFEYNMKTKKGYNFVYEI